MTLTARRMRRATLVIAAHAAFLLSQCGGRTELGDEASSDASVSDVFDSSDAASDEADVADVHTTDACGCSRTLAEVCDEGICPPSFDASALANWLDAQAPLHCGNECFADGCTLTDVTCSGVDCPINYLFDNGKLVMILPDCASFDCVADPSDCPPPTCVNTAYFPCPDE